MARFCALAVAVCLAATIVLPARDGYRCVTMNKVMAPESDCPHCEARPMSIGDRCCEKVRVGALDARASSTVHEPRITPAPLLAVLSESRPRLISLAAQLVSSWPRGSPPGDRLGQLSTILRI